ncbi:BQ5605_C006g03939 [Microbotryum silenes-dioicae]|uniref:BQ5605_C006g03939 protein n=1 Tax=Microbotryum silenes-dioicae TaxID=796604 RepID=A0A2X0M5G1_9BASI|nr:BQ5605_C006g03939 [Microbotryum silenes-dioicae]
MSLARVRKIWLSALQNTQFIVTTLTIVLLLRLRTAHALWFGAGTLCAAFSAKVLKRFIRQPRPDGALHYETTYGMPSTHSSSIAYFGTYLTLSSLLLPFHPRISSLIPFYVHIVKVGSDKFISGENLIRLSLACLFVFSASSVCSSRIRLGHHTKAQVIVGALLGTGVACVWFVLWIGVDRAFELTSRIGGTRWRNGHFKLAYPWIPAFFRDGVHEYGTGWERIAEDTLLLSLEIWASGDWRRGVGEMGKVLKGGVVGGMSREEL